MSKGSYLIHYASEYYDPVKAHEYYMKNRELKGRQTKNLSDEQKSNLSYLKSTIDSQRDRAIEQRTEQYRRDVNNAGEEMRSKISEENQRKADELKRKSGQVQSNIKSLREKLANMSPYFRAHNSERILKEIDGLRKDNDRVRAEVTEETQKTIESIRSNNSSKRESLANQFKSDKVNIKQEYADKYAEEYNKLISSFGVGSSDGKTKTKTERKKNRTYQDVMTAAGR